MNLRRYETKPKGVKMAKEIKLPKPKEKGTTSIEETLNKRRSVRDYKRGALSLEQVPSSFGQLRAETFIGERLLQLEPPTL